MPMRALKPVMSVNILPEATGNLSRVPVMSGYHTWLASARHSFEKGDYPGYQQQGNWIPTAAEKADK